VGKSFAEKSPNEALLCIGTNAIHAAEKGMVYTNQLSVARKEVPQGQTFAFSWVVHPPLGLAPAGKPLTRVDCCLVTARMRHLALGEKAQY
jgi:hypothetical protein